MITITNSGLCLGYHNIVGYCVMAGPEVIVVEDKKNPDLTPPRSIKSLIKIQKVKFIAQSGREARRERRRKERKLNIKLKL